jgi:hypothetical protein
MTTNPIRGDEEGFYRSKKQPLEGGKCIKLGVWQGLSRAALV